MRFDLRSVTEVGHWDYDWSTTECFYDPEYGRYRVDSDAGCSCNGPWDYHYSKDEFGPLLDLGEAVKVFREQARGGIDAREKAIQEIYEFDRELKAVMNGVD